MNLRRYLPYVAVCAMGLAASSLAHADTFSTSGTFTTDDQVYEYDFSSTTAQNYSFTTTSYASGGFVPVLTLFSGAGDPIDTSTEGPGPTTDASLMDTLNPGSYILTLTEFPNTAVGTFSQGFLFAGDPTITGDTCSMPGTSFVDTTTTACMQRTGNYALDVTSTSSPTPEPSSWLLVLPGAAVLALSSRRRRLA